ncbi:MAG: hypothetical protein RL386_56 [Bacteroidota bacterium]|jgi:hypothetical protein
MALFPTTITHRNKSKKQKIMAAEKSNTLKTFVPSTMLKPMLIGSLIGFGLILFFLLSAGEGNPAWPKFWQVKPLLVVPMAGAAAGMFYHYMNDVRSRGGWQRIAADFLSLVVLLFCLWIGSVLGLNGTYWN